MKFITFICCLNNLLLVKSQFASNTNFGYGFPTYYPPQGYSNPQQSVPKGSFQQYQTPTNSPPYKPSNTGWPINSLRFDSNTPSNARLQTNDNIFYPDTSPITGCSGQQYCISSWCTCLPYSSGSTSTSPPQQGHPSSTSTSTPFQTTPTKRSTIPDTTTRPKIPDTTTKPTESSQQETLPSSQYTERRSEKKCKEYKKLFERTIVIDSFLPSSSGTEITTSTCDRSVALIFNGTKAKDGEFPHAAAIAYREAYSKDYGFYCGGSLISENFVLTAAHCKSRSGQNATFVRLGLVNITSSKAGSDYAIANFIAHEDYNPQTKKNDIALIKLARNVSFNDNFLNIKPACLHQIYSAIPDTAIVTGWGRTEGKQFSEVLLQTELDIIGKEHCKEFTDFLDRSDAIDVSQICAGDLKHYGRDSCEGDSGSGLVTLVTECAYSIIGVVSFGITNRCGEENSPGIYTKVSHYIDWIESEVWK